jgi:alkylation response protein AidB-like acyl-CoA dehydrogenase
MDFDWSEDARTTFDLAEKILRGEVSEASLREIDKEQSFFHARAWKLLGEAGLLGVAIEEAHGGMGGGVAELCALLRAVGRHVAPIPALSCLALGALPIARFGDARQKARLLPRVALGTGFVSGAFEEQPGEARRAPVARATEQRSGLRVTGTKLCVPLADRAERIVTPVGIDGEGVALLLVDPKLRGVSLERSVETHGEPVFRMELCEVEVAAEDVLVRGASAHEALAFMHNAALAAACAAQLGVSERALELTARYTSERKQFGVPIGSFQAVRQRAADAYIDVQAIRLSLQQAVFLLDQGRDASLACSVAKFHACEAGYRVAFAAQHLHGGIGYDVDYPLHRHYLWSKALELTLGPAPEQLSRIGEILAQRSVRIGE